MHEMSLLNDLMKKIHTVASEHGGSKVERVSVTLGALSHLSADHFREHFVHASRGTIAEGAHLEIQLDTDTADPHAQDIVLRDVELAIVE